MPYAPLISAPSVLLIRTAAQTLSHQSPVPKAVQIDGFCDAQYGPPLPIFPFDAMALTESIVVTLRMAPSAMRRYV